MKNNKRHKPEFKTKVVLEILKDNRNLKDIINEYEITYSTLRI
jgi:transposase-like protein